MQFRIVFLVFFALSFSLAAGCGDEEAATGGSGGAAGSAGVGDAGGVAGTGGASGDGGVGGRGGIGGGSGGEGGTSAGDAIAATFAVCCEITEPVNIGLVDASVDATALPTTALVPGQSASITIEGAVDLTDAIPVQIDASLINPSTFTLAGVAGTTLSSTRDIPTPFAFNTGDDPLLIDIGSHEVSIDVDPDAVEVCLDLMDTQVTVSALGTEIGIPCTPGTCAGASNAPACADVSP